MFKITKVSYKFVSLLDSQLRLSQTTSLNYFRQLSSTFLDNYLRMSKTIINQYDKIIVEQYFRLSQTFVLVHEDEGVDHDESAQFKSWIHSERQGCLGHFYYTNLFHMTSVTIFSNTTPLCRITEDCDTCHMKQICIIKVT